jgi:nitrogen fixation protein FixH
MMFRWWMAPVIGVGTIACANAVLIFTSVKVRPQKVEERPYAASAHEDARADERAAFAARGWRLDSAVDAAAATLTLVAPGPDRPLTGLVRIYRPDDVAADHEVVWTDPGTPLRCPLPRPGVWQVRIAIQDAAGVTLAHEFRIQRP